MPFAPSPTDGSIPTDLVLLAAERAVTVTREEYHQDVLSGRTGRAVVELRPCPIASGKHAGQDGLEVMLDGRRVGELTRMMAQRYRPVVDHLTAGGYRAGCEALLHDDARGTQVELRLPAGPTTAGLPTTRRPAPAPTVRQPPAVAATPTTVAPHVVPRQRPPAPTTAIPHRPHPPTAVTPIPPAPEQRRRSRRALWVTAAVIGTLTVASALGNAARDDPPATVSPLPTAAAAPSTYSPALPAAPVTSPTPADDAVDEPVAAPAPHVDRTARPPAAATSKPVIRASATTSKPAPRTVQAAPKPAPAPAPKPEPKPSGCDPNYSGCVPIASDVDCAGGSGDGPAVRDGARAGHRDRHVRPGQRQGRSRLRVASPPWTLTSSWSAPASPAWSPPPSSPTPGAGSCSLDQEPEANLGGQAFWSFGGLFLVDSPEQRRMGIRDSARARPAGLARHGGLRPRRRRPRRRGPLGAPVGHGLRRLRRRREAGLAARRWACGSSRSSAGPSAAATSPTATATRCRASTSPGAPGPGVARAVRAAGAAARRRGPRRAAVPAPRRRARPPPTASVDGVRGAVLEPSDAARGRASSREPDRRRSTCARRPCVVTRGGIGADHDLVRAHWPARLGAAAGADDLRRARARRRPDARRSPRRPARGW